MLNEEDDYCEGQDEDFQDHNSSKHSPNADFDMDDMESNPVTNNRSKAPRYQDKGVVIDDDDDEEASADDEHSPSSDDEDADEDLYDPDEDVEKPQA